MSQNVKFTDLIRTNIPVKINHSTRSIPKPDSKKKRVISLVPNTRSLRDNPNQLVTIDIEADFYVVSNEPIIPTLVYVDCCDRLFDVNATYDPESFPPSQSPFQYIKVILVNNTTGEYKQQIFMTLPVSNSFIFTDNAPGNYRMEIDIVYSPRQTDKYVALFNVIPPNLCSVHIEPSIQCLPCYGANDGTLTAVTNPSSSTEWCVAGETSHYLYRWNHTVDGELFYIDPVTGEDSTDPDNTWGEDFNTLSSLPAGKYCVDVKQVCKNRENEIVESSCIVSACATINEPLPISAKLCLENIEQLCYGDKNGIAKLWVNGGEMPYNYTLYILENSQFVMFGDTNGNDTRYGLGAGTYKFVSVDANGCSVEKNFIITQPPQLTVTLSNDPSLKCCNLVANAQGGTPITNDSFCCDKVNVNNSEIGPNNYTYKWVNKSNPDVIIGNKHYIKITESGEYEVTVTDGRCCSVKASSLLILQKDCNPCGSSDTDTCSDHSSKPKPKPKPNPKPKPKPKPCNTKTTQSMTVKVNKILISETKFGIDIVVDGNVGSVKYTINDKPIDNPERIAFTNGRQYKLTVTDTSNQTVNITF